MLELRIKKNSNQNLPFLFNSTGRWASNREQELVAAFPLSARAWRVACGASNRNL